MERARTKSGIRGFTLTEILVVVAIIGIVLGMGTYAITKHAPQRKISTYSRILLSDMRFTQFRSQSDGQPYVFEIVSYGVIPFTGTPVFRLNDIYRIWKMSDWLKYFKHSCASVTLHKAGFPIPLTVYDVTTGNPPGNGSVLNQGQCEDNDPASITPSGEGLSAGEVPLPLIEFVHETYQDPPSVAADPDWRIIRRMPSFERRYKIPDNVDLLTSQPSTGTSYYGYYIIFYPAGGTAGYFYRLPAVQNPPPSDAIPTWQPITTGLFDLGMLLSKDAALGKNYQVDASIVGPANRMTPIYAQVSRYCSSNQNSKEIEILLGSGQVSLNDATPQDFGLPLATNPNCVLNWNDSTQGPLSVGQPVWK